MSYRRGEIVWVKFPFTDASSSKLRPALVLSNQIVNKTGDYLLMQITTRIRNDEFSLLISNDYYADKPLLRQGELRLHKIFILNEDLIAGSITKVSEAFMNTAVNKLLTLIQ